MVHRQRLSALLCIVVAAWLLPAATAVAQDQKVAIGHYQWSTQVVNVDLGQRVTWYWVGPDTMHSVTGISGNDSHIDSDPNTNEPEHTVGSQFSVTFTTPGIYQFQCKLHPIVHGEVIVSPIPGNPNDDPEPVPPNNVDLTAPTVNRVFLAPSHFTVTRGTSLHFSLDKSAKLDAEIWHAGPHGKRGRYAGYQTWQGHIGFNQVPFAHRSLHFRPAPGNYIAYLTATDAVNNQSHTLRIAFTIASPSARARDP